MAAKARSAFRDKKIVARALKDSILKLNPKTQVKNPVMLLVFLSAILTTGLWIVSLFGIKDAPSGYTLAIAVILWFTVLFANFAEAIAEGRGKAQADALRAAKKDVDAHKIPCAAQKDEITVVSSVSLKKGDIVIVKAGEQIPADGEVIEGAASVDESAITRRVRACYPRKRRRPQRSHRRHNGSVGLDRRGGYKRSGRKLPRSDDRHGGRRGAQENAE